MTDPRHALGRRAEAAAAAWLAGRGWQVLARRWRSPFGELDLVCRDPSACLVGVEVKLRRSPRAGAALEALDARRIRRLRATLASWATEGGTPHAGIRLDLVTLSPAADGRYRLTRIEAVDRW